MWRENVVPPGYNSIVRTFERTNVRSNCRAIEPVFDQGGGMGTTTAGTPDVTKAPGRSAGTARRPAVAPDHAAGGRGRAALGGRSGGPGVGPRQGPAGSPPGAGRGAGGTGRVIVMPGRLAVARERLSVPAGRPPAAGERRPAAGKRSARAGQRAPAARGRSAAAGQRPPSAKGRSAAAAEGPTALRGRRAAGRGRPAGRPRGAGPGLGGAEARRRPAGPPRRLTLVRGRAAGVADGAVAWADGQAVAGTDGHGTGRRGPARPAARGLAPMPRRTARVTARGALISRAAADGPDQRARPRV